MLSSEKLLFVACITYKRLHDGANLPGIDAAKDSFVVATRLEGKVTTSLYNTTGKAFKGSSKPARSLLAHYGGNRGLQPELTIALYEKGIKVSVVNPLQIKRFAQTKLKRTKTDKVDAALIAEYGERM